MQIIFWQNIISPHQSFLIRELAKRHDVTLTVLDTISEERLKQGWSIPDTGNAKIIHLKNEKVALDLQQNNINAIHIFSGIANYKIIKNVFRQLNKKAKIGVIAEAGSSIGWKKYFRKLIYMLKYIRYNNKIDFIFAMGDLGVNYYQSVGFNKSKLHKFQYFTELPNVDSIKEFFFDTTPKLLFIGQLIDRKNIQGLVEALIDLKNIQFKLDIIGDGPLKNVLKNLVQESKVEEKFTFLGNLDNNDAMKLLTSSDYLILPSHFDGWGAVINEALSRGVKVITNENCGASCMVKEMNWGTVYKNNDNLELALKNALGNFQKETLVERKRIAAQFADKYSNTIVNKFEEVLLTK